MTGRRARAVAAAEELNRRRRPPGVEVPAAGDTSRRHRVDRSILEARDRHGLGAPRSDEYPVSGWPASASGADRAQDFEGGTVYLDTATGRADVFGWRAYTPLAIHTAEPTTPSARTGEDRGTVTPGPCVEPTAGAGWVRPTGADVDDGAEHEVPLVGGNLTVGVVRVGDTVRRPAGPHTPAVHALLRHLESVGFDGAPRALGIDDRGREVLSFVPGSVAHPDHNEVLASDAALREVVRRIRDFHSASAEFTPPPEARWQRLIDHVGDELVAHNDLGRWNLIARGPADWVFVDWDLAAPADRLWDLALAVHGLVPMTPRRERGLEDVDRDRRLATIASTYRLDQADRLRLLELLPRRTEVLHRLIAEGAAAGEEPWSTMLREGHHRAWAEDTDFIAEHRERWRQALLDGD